MEELIIKSKEGDKESFTQLIISIESDLYKIARMRLNNDEDIEDAVQETIIEAFKNIRKLKHNNFFKTWIIKILINKCNKTYRNNKRNSLSLEQIELEKYYYKNDSIYEDSNLEFEILISNLKYKERIVLILYYLEDFTIAEIAKILSLPVSTIKNRLLRARNKLKEVIEREEKYE